MKIPLLSLTLTFALAASLFANRAIQIREVDFTTSVIELTNTGTTTQALDGWKFCSHDETQFRRYSSSTGLNGLSLAAGESLFIHFLNDAPTGDATTINISGRGNFATPLDRGPYSIQLYNGGTFNDGNNIIDHLQWSIDGVGNTTADERSDEAENGGVWTDQSLWIATTASSEKVTLSDTTGGILHSPANYDVAEPVTFPTTFMIDDPIIGPNGDVTLNWEDLSAFGVTEYIVEVSTDLTDTGWQVAAGSPFTTTSATLAGTADQRLFFRVVAQLPLIN